MQFIICHDNSKDIHPKKLSMRKIRIHLLSKRFSKLVNKLDLKCREFTGDKAEGG